MYIVVYLRNGVGSFATVMKTETLQDKLAKYYAAGWKVFASLGKLFDSYSEAQTLAATL